MTRHVHLEEVSSDGGLVAAPDIRAAEAGASMLRAGGNAVDAAVAAAFAIAVVEPFMSGLGGGTWMVSASREPERYVVVEGSVRAPWAARPDMFALAADGATGLYGWPRVVDDANVIGARSVGVPGTVAALCLAQERLGRLRREQVLEPAIRLAADGIEVNAFCSALIVQEAANLRKDPGCAALFLPDGLPLRSQGQLPPDRLRQPALAQTLQVIAAEGTTDFYQGGIGDAIVDTVASAGGILSRKDLADYRARMFESPLKGAYRGTAILGPAGTGVPTVIQALQLFEAAGSPVESAPRALAWARALRLAFGDRFTYMCADPAVDVPWEGLLSPIYARALFEASLAGRPVPKPHDFAGVPRSQLTSHASAPERSGCTSHISTVDRWGNMVSLTQTVLDLFGARLLEPETGILLNDGMMWFDPRPGTINSIRRAAPGLTAVSPVILVSERGPMAAIGAAGGRKLISCTAQVAAAVVAGTSLQEAIESPRIHTELDAVLVDARESRSVVDGLQDAGFPVEVVQEELATFYFGRPHGILIDANGIRRGGADPIKPSGVVAG